MSSSDKDKAGAPDEAAKAKLKDFLQSGNPEDIASVIYHTLIHRADVAAQVQNDLIEGEAEDQTPEETTDA